MVSTIYWAPISTPIGVFTVMATDKGVCWVGLPNTSLEKGKKWTQRFIGSARFIQAPDNPSIKQATTFLSDYMAGKMHTSTISFDIYGSNFQKHVWKELLKIGWGNTKTYKAMAALVGKPTASRAIGAACRTNPIALFIPCHRVIGSNGKLTGYGGGISTKEWLLAHEKKVLFTSVGR